MFFYFIGIIIVLGIGFAVLLKELRTHKQQPLQQVPIQEVKIDLQPLHKAMEAIPSKVLQSITSSTNTHKGTLGELIGYIQLRASYDRIIPLGNIVDFVCIKFPIKESPGHIDFIDIKTGDKCRLSKDQRALQGLIEDKKINFIKIKVETGSSEG